MYLVPTWVMKMVTRFLPERDDKEGSWNNHGSYQHKSQGQHWEPWSKPKITQGTSPIRNAYHQGKRHTVGKVVRCHNIWGRQQRGVKEMIEVSILGLMHWSVFLLFMLSNDGLRHGLAVCLLFLMRVCIWNRTWETYDALVMSFTYLWLYTVMLMSFSLAVTGLSFYEIIDILCFNSY